MPRGRYYPAGGHSRHGTGSDQDRFHHRLLRLHSRLLRTSQPARRRQWEGLLSGLRQGASSNERGHWAAPTRSVQDRGEHRHSPSASFGSRSCRSARTASLATHLPPARGVTELTSCHGCATDTDATSAGSSVFMPEGIDQGHPKHELQGQARLRHPPSLCDGKSAGRDRQRAKAPE
jgi:hypothetical protein